MTVIPVPLNVGQAVIPDPIDAVIREAKRYLFVREDAGNNRSIHIDYWNYESVGVWKDFPIGGRGAPWCMSYVYGIGRQALGHAWPVPRTASVQAVADWALDKGILFDKPERGDLGVVFYPNLSPARYGHVFITQVTDVDTILTIEGNTNDGGSREGYGVFERNRTLSDRLKFVRWVKLL